jgi:hypothetical protein
MSAADATNPNQFGAHWRNAETGEMESVATRCTQRTAQR